MSVILYWHCCLAITSYCFDSSWIYQLNFTIFHIYIRKFIFSTASVVWVYRFLYGSAQLMSCTSKLGCDQTFFLGILDLLPSILPLKNLSHLAILCYWNDLSSELFFYPVTISLLFFARLFPSHPTFSAFPRFSSLINGFILGTRILEPLVLSYHYAFDLMRYLEIQKYRSPFLWCQKYNFLFLFRFLI